MKTTIVTGGAGFIGTNFVHHLMRTSDERVVVFDKLTYAGCRENLAEFEGDPRFEFVVGDVSDRKALDALLARTMPRRVVHFAAESHVDRSIDGPGAFVETNVRGSFELLEATRAHLAARPELADSFRLLQVSTDEVFGSLGPQGAFDEDSPYRPNSPYAASKAAADHFARAYHVTFGLPVIVTHCSNNYGPYQFPEKLIPLMLLNALEGRELPVYGDGRQVRDWLHVEDHCRGLVLALERGEPGRCYAFGGGEELENRHLVETLCSLLDERRPASTNDALVCGSYAELVRHVADRPGHDRRYAIDAGRAKDELGWSPSVSFAEGLAATIEWYLERLDWCARITEERYRRERLGLADGG